MKKILGLTIAALLVMALVGGGTWAYFSDPETSTGNILQAGTLDLELNGANADIKVVDTSVNNVAPGDSQSDFITLSNAGSNAGELDIAIGVITNTGAVSGTSEYADDTGDLGGLATIAIWIDVNSNDTWDSGDIELEPTGADPYDTDATLDGATVNSFGSVFWDNVYTGVDPMIAAASDKFYIDWAVGTGVGNNIQGDSVSWTITFTLEQGAVD